MEYKVIKPFRDIDGSFKMMGDSVKADDQRAAKLRRHGVIGGRLEQAVTNQKEIATEPQSVRAVDPEKEIRSEKKRK
jgi:hypothetical protein